MYQFWSYDQFMEIRDRINHEMQRRGTYRWWDPLVTPKVGEDKSSPLSIPSIGKRVPVDDETYTVNTPSEGSIERTRNATYPAHGDNPSGERYKSSSGDQINFDEMRNLLVGLSKIDDIDLFYGRDEDQYLAFRDLKGIFELLDEAVTDILNLPLTLSDLSGEKNDPNGGTKHGINAKYPVKYKIAYPMVDGEYVMHSGESDGDEADEYGQLGPENFFDDYGAPKGEGSYHPYNRATSELVNRSWMDHDKDRNIQRTTIYEGGKPSSRFGINPRNPNPGDSYRDRPVYGGVKGSCNVACTGMCSLTCDNECSESCTTTCFGRCGEACSSTCGNVCTGCSSLCLTSCKTKCENTTGYACVAAGAKAVKIETHGGKNGKYAENVLEVTIHTCEACSYSCQFYPNKKTECWDSGCMGKCFTSCEYSCSISCHGGCIDNAEESGNPNPKKIHIR